MTNRPQNNPLSQASHEAAVLRRATGRDEWEAAIAPHPGATAFHAWNWLEWVAPMLQCRFLPLIVLDRTDAPVGAMPLLLKPRGPVQTANWVPFPYLGPLVPAEQLGPTLDALRRIGRRQRVVDLQVSVHPFTPDALACGTTFRLHGIDQHVDGTYIVTLADRALSDLEGSLSQSTRRRLRLAAESGLELRPSTPGEVAELLPHIANSALARQGLKSPYSAQLGPKLATSPPAVPLHITSAVLGDTTVGVLATLGGPISVGWIGGVLDQYRRTDANIALVWDAITWAHSTQSDHLDMVGLPTPGIAAFKKQFGGTLHSYPVGHYCVPLYSTARRLHAQASRRVGAPADRNVEARNGPRA